MNKIKGFFKKNDEESFSKQIFIKNLKVGVLAGVTGIIIGATVNSGSSQIQELETKVNDIEVKKDKFVQLSSDRSEEISTLKLQNASLQTKVDTASPWFAMEEKERQAESERIAQEKVQQEAEVKAQKEEEQRIAEEQRVQAEAESQRQAEADRVAKEKAEKQKYNTGISVKDIERDKDGLKSSYVKFKGKIVQVVEDGPLFGHYRLAVDNDYNKVVLIYVNITVLDTNILVDDIITIEGKSLGNKEYTTVLGETRGIATIDVDNVYR